MWMPSLKNSHKFNHFNYNIFPFIKIAPGEGKARNKIFNIYLWIIYMIENVEIKSEKIISDPYFLKWKLDVGEWTIFKDLYFMCIICYFLYIETLNL